MDWVTSFALGLVSRARPLAEPSPPSSSGSATCVGGSGSTPEVRGCHRWSLSVQYSLTLSGKLVSGAKRSKVCFLGPLKVLWARQALSWAIREPRKQ